MRRNVTYIRAVLVPPLRCMWAFAFLASSLSWGASARAQSGDGAYGRLAGDLAMSGLVGAGYVTNAEPKFALTAELRARFLDSAGLLIAPEYREERASRIVIALDVRPIFLGRFLMNAESGRRFVDLLVDSIGIDIGTAIGPLHSGLGAAFAIGFGFDVPLVSPSESAAGLFLRCSARHTAAPSSFASGPSGGASDWLFLVGLGYKIFADTGIASWQRTTSAPSRRKALPEPLL